jgi:N-acetylglucosamine-6-sulfatase
MLTVDDTLGTLRKTLKAKGILENTYIILTSDNGYHLGLHRLPKGKWTAFEHDIRVPLYI